MPSQRPPSDSFFSSSRPCFSQHTWAAQQAPNHRCVHTQKWTQPLLLIVVSLHALSPHRERSYVSNSSSNEGFTLDSCSLAVREEDKEERLWPDSSGQLLADVDGDIGVDAYELTGAGWDERPDPLWFQILSVYWIPGVRVEGGGLKTLRAKRGKEDLRISQLTAGMLYVFGKVRACFYKGQQ